MIYILVIMAYLAIGGFLAGLFDDAPLDNFYWYLAWPGVLIVVLILLLEVPFERLGYHVLNKLRDIRKRKK